MILCISLAVMWVRARACCSRVDASGSSSGHAALRRIARRAQKPLVLKVRFRVAAYSVALKCALSVAGACRRQPRRERPAALARAAGGGGRCAPHAAWLSARASAGAVALPDDPITLARLDKAASAGAPFAAVALLTLLLMSRSEWVARREFSLCAQAAAERKAW